MWVMGPDFRLEKFHSCLLFSLIPSVQQPELCLGGGGPRRAGEDIFFALITSEKRPSGRANFGGSAFSRDRFDYKSSVLMLVPKVCHSVCPRDK